MIHNGNFLKSLIINPCINILNNPSCFHLFLHVLVKTGLCVQVCGNYPVEKCETVVKQNCQAVPVQNCSQQCQDIYWCKECTEH
jgi:hypothetical protein